MLNFGIIFIFLTKNVGFPSTPSPRKNGADTSKTRRGEEAHKEVRDRATTLYCEVYPPFFYLFLEVGGKVSYILIVNRFVQRGRVKIAHVFRRLGFLSLFLFFGFFGFFGVGGTVFAAAFYAVASHFNHRLVTNRATLARGYIPAHKFTVGITRTAVIGLAALQAWAPRPSASTSSFCRKDSSDKRGISQIYRS